MALTSSLNGHAALAYGTNAGTTPAQPVACGRFLVSTSNDVTDFSGAWPALRDADGESVALAFQCRDHIAIWQETIGAAGQVTPFIVQVTDQAGRALMTIPMGVSRRGPVRVLGFLDGGVADYNAPVLHRAAADITADEMRALWAVIRNRAPHFDIWALEKCPTSVDGIANPMTALTPEPWPLSGHELRLTPDVLKASGFAADSRRQRKRLAEIGPVSFEIVTSDMDTVFDAFVRQKSRRYRETLGHGGFDVPGQRDYYHTLATRLSPAGTAQLSCLRVGDEIVAMHWGLVAGKRFYYMMPAYEGGSWRRYSPGRLLMEDLMDWSLRNGLALFDFGIGDEDYKRKWRADEVPLWGGSGARTLAGRLYLTALLLRARLKLILPASSIAAIKTILRH